MEIMVGDIVSYAANVWRVIALNDRYVWLASLSLLFGVPARHSIRVERERVRQVQDTAKDEENDGKKDE